MPNLNFENVLEVALYGVLSFAQGGQLVFANNVRRKIFMSEEAE